MRGETVTFSLHSSRQTPANISPRRRVRDWIVFGTVCAAGIVADQATKAAAQALPLGELHHAAGPLFVRRVENPGVALGALPGGDVSLAVVGLLLVGLVAIFLAWGKLHPVFGPACALATAGCAGNLVERLQHGHVTDFASLAGLPIFNVADVFIVAGFAIMLGTSVLADLREHPEHDDDLSSGTAEPEPALS
jgi:signal peptidase II